METLAQTGSITGSARAAGMQPSTFYRLRDRDPDFAEAWDDAEEEAYDALITAARQRAIHGVEKPMVSAGKLVCRVQEYSDGLMSKLLDKTAPRRRRAVERADPVDPAEVIAGDAPTLAPDEPRPSDPVL